MWWSPITTHAKKKMMATVNLPHIPYSIRVFPALIVTLAATFTVPALAQDSEFIACARFDDRAQRIACLEDALEASVPGTAEDSNTAAGRATPPQAQTAAPAPAVPRESSETTQAAAVETSPIEKNAVRTDNDAERIENFGQARIEDNAQGKEELFDTVTALERRRNLLRVTLSSGQVWAQTYPRFYNLKEGDDIRIYQEGIGDAYRLATERLNGFIRVERVE